RGSAVPGLTPPAWQPAPDRTRRSWHTPGARGLQLLRSGWAAVGAEWTSQAATPYPSSGSSRDACPATVREREPAADGRRPRLALTYLARGFRLAAPALPRLERDHRLNEV